MFLEFTKAPKDYVTRSPEDDPDLLNEYSVFGAGTSDAAVQVTDLHIHVVYCSTVRYIYVMTSYSLYNCTVRVMVGTNKSIPSPVGVHNEDTGCGGCDLCALDVGHKTSLPPLPTQEKEQEGQQRHCIQT